MTDHYTVEAHWQDRVDNGLILDTFRKESGFSGTLFKSTEKDSNGKERYVLAFKGTDDGKDLFIADAGDIFNDGLAHHQIVDMYNFWQQIKAEKGKTYTVAKIINVSADPNYVLSEIYKNATDEERKELADEWFGKGYFIDTFTPKKIIFVNSDEYYQDERATGLGIDPGQVITTGHSLGGHLSAAFSRLFSNDVEHSVILPKNNNT